MADWFKFYNDALDSKGLQFAMSEQPLVTSVWLVIMSEASKNRSSKFRWHDEDFELIGFARKINVSVHVFNQCIGILERIGYITRKDGTIQIHGWNNLQSDYARGLDRGYYKDKKTRKKLASNLLVSTTRGEERRGENKRVPEGSHGVLVSNLLRLYKRSPTSQLEPAEEHAVFEVSKRANIREEIVEILAYERECNPAYFPRSLLRLVENWQSTLDNARRKQTPEQNEKPKSPQVAAAIAKQKAIENGQITPQ